MPIEQSKAIITNSMLNMGNLMNYNDPLVDFSLLTLNGRAIPSGINLLVPLESVKGVNLFYIPEVTQTRLVERIKVPTQSQDITVTRLTEDLLTDISSQIDSNITVHTMQMNRHEFIIYFNILCDYIDDINLILDMDTDNQYIRDIQVEKNVISTTFFVFRLYQDFGTYNRG